MNELNIIKKSIKDYLTLDMLKLLLYPLAGSIIVLYVTFFAIADFGLDSLEQTRLQINEQHTVIQNGVESTEQTDQSYTGSAVIDFLLKHTVTSWIVGFLVYTVGFFAIGYMSIFVSLLIIGLLTPRILSMIRQRHYKEIELKGYGNFSEGLSKLFLSAVVMIILFLFLIPLYFIPLVNIFAINLPFFYFFHKMLHFDVGSTLMSKERFSKIYYFNKNKMRYRTLFLYTISLIPFAAFFLSVFYVVYLGHAYFSELQKDLKTQGNDLIRNY